MKTSRLCNNHHPTPTLLGKSFYFLLLLRMDEKPWIGLSATQTYGVFRWITGAGLKWQQWQSGLAPSGEIDYQGCVKIRHNADTQFYLSKETCDRPESYICQTKPSLGS